jgi:hypothetical protein
LDADSFFFDLKIMDKDKSILELIERLKSVADFNCLEIHDRWEVYLCAIGFKIGKKLIYINTHSYLDEVVPRYDYDIEINDESSSRHIEVIKEIRGASESELIEEIQFLILPERQYH